MLKSKNIMLFIAIAVFAIFSIFYFITVNKMSYAFDYNAEEEKYNARINYIKISAKNYAKLHEDELKDDTLYVTVDTLVKEGLLIADDEEGNYNNPLSEIKTLNDIKVRVQKKSDGEYTAKILN